LLVVVGHVGGDLPDSTKDRVAVGVAADHAAQAVVLDDGGGIRARRAHGDGEQCDGHQCECEKSDSAGQHTFFRHRCLLPSFCGKASARLQEFNGSAHCDGKGLAQGVLQSSPTASVGYGCEAAPSESCRSRDEETTELTTERDSVEVLPCRNARAAQAAATD